MRMLMMINDDNNWALPNQDIDCLVLKNFKIVTKNANDDDGDDDDDDDDDDDADDTDDKDETMSVGGKTGRRDDNGQRKRFGRRLVFMEKENLFCLLSC